MSSKAGLNPFGFPIWNSGSLRLRSGPTHVDRSLINTFLVDAGFFMNTNMIIKWI